MKTMYFIGRIITSPAILLLLIVGYAIIILKGIYLWIANGGELIILVKDDRPSINKIYAELRRKNEIFEKINQKMKRNEETRNN